PGDQHLAGVDAHVDSYAISLFSLHSFNADDVFLPVHLDRFAKLLALVVSSDNFLILLNGHRWNTVLLSQLFGKGRRHNLPPNMNDLDNEDSKKDTLVDVVFKKALKEFRQNIFSSYSSALAMDDGKSIRYKDLYALFEQILEKTMRLEQLCKYACHKKCCLKTTAKCSKKYDPELSSRQFGVELSRLTSEDRAVPLVVEKLINYIEMHGLYTEGIYRKSGSTNKIKELRQGLDTVRLPSMSDVPEETITNETAMETDITEQQQAAMQQEEKVLTEQIENLQKEKKRFQIYSKSPFYRAASACEALGTEGPLGQAKSLEDRPQFISRGTFNPEKGKQKLKNVKSSPQKTKETPEGTVTSGRKKTVDPDCSSTQQLPLFGNNEFMSPQLLVTLELQPPPPVQREQLQERGPPIYTRVQRKVLGRLGAVEKLVCIFPQHDEVDTAARSRLSAQVASTSSPGLDSVPGRSYHR
ncbi:hypothetical protein A6R68_22854, partial [Neotoma lepida]